MLHLTTVENSTYILLQKLSNINFIKNNFALAGGTSLSLQIGHRKSIDLDFFTTKPFNVEELELLLSNEKDFQYKLIGSNSRMFFCYMDNVKCDFVYEPAKLINPFLEIDNVKYFSVQDIAAMKMHTICGREKKRIFLIFMRYYKFILGKNC